MSFGCVVTLNSEIRVSTATVLSVNYDIPHLSMNLQAHCLNLVFSVQQRRSGWVAFKIACCNLIADPPATAWWS
jgi:hypothetical protein